MLERARRPAASLCLALLAFDVSCSRVKQHEAAHVIPPGTTGALHQEIRGVTLRNGSEVRFDKSVTSYVNNDTLYSLVRGARYGVAVANVQRVWVASIDRTRTTIAVIGVAVGVIALAAAIASGQESKPQTTTESCPFVYSWDGTQYVFDAEPYGGATTRGMERDDYGDLEHLRPDSAGMYRLLVTNEVPETQYTNSMRLFVVDHRPGSRFAMDEFGRLHAVSAAMPPTSARDQEGHDLAPWLRADDHMIWEPMPSADTAGPVRQEIVLTFPKPRGATRGKLVARVGTGLWGSHMIRDLLAMRGAAVKEWYARLDSSRPLRDSLMMWNVREELYVLKLDVQEAGAWRTRGLLPGGGPYMTENRVVPLDVRGVVGDSLRVRIRPPSGFWALNSFAMSYDDAEQPVAVDTVAPLAARTHDGRDVLAELAASDAQYYAMPTNDDRATLSFRAPPPRAGTERTVFLHSRGYYKLHLDEQGAPNTTAIQRIIDVPDAAARMAAVSFAKRQLAAAGTR
jgi:hypothetical protein